MLKRAAFFVDGFNFYHAVAKRQKPHLLWMSYRRLAELLINPEAELLGDVFLFSAYATHKPLSMVRHRQAVAAWENDGCRCILGSFKRKRVYCKTCATQTPHHEEKESDVNIAIHLLNEARKGTFDVAYVIGNDSDLSPAFRMLKTEYPHLEIVTVSPPDRKTSNSLKEAGQARTATVNWTQVESCLMPAQISDAAGRVVALRPPEYAPP